MQVACHVLELKLLVWELLVEMLHLVQHLIWYHAQLLLPQHQLLELSNQLHIYMLLPKSYLQPLFVHKELHQHKL